MAESRRKAAPPRQLSLRSTGGGHWEVTSRRGELVNVYHVDPNRLACDCPSGHRARRCAHLGAVLDHLTGREQMAGDGSPGPLVGADALDHPA